MGSGNMTIENLHKYINLHIHGKVVNSPLRNLVSAIDARANEIIEDLTNQLNVFFTALAAIVDDMKQRHPALINNIKVIGGDNNSDYMKMLVERYHDMEKFLAIMKRFTIIAPQKQASAAGVRDTEN